MKPPPPIPPFLLGALIGGTVAYILLADPKKRAIIQRLASDLGGLAEEKIDRLKDWLTQAAPIPEP